MKFLIGDRVKFLNDVGGGKVVKIIDPQTVLVETDEGFEYPQLINELIIDSQASERDLFEVKQSNQTQKQQQKQTLEQKIEIERTQALKKDNEDTNVYLAFIKQKKDDITDLEIHLINDSNWNLLYVLQTRNAKTYESTPGTLAANYVENIATYKLSVLSEMKEIVLQIIFYRQTPYDFKEPIVKSFSVNPTKFFNDENYLKNEFFDQKALIFTVTEENPLIEAVSKLKEQQVSNVINEKEFVNKKINKPLEYVSQKKDDTLEIDLHINELVDDTTGLDAKAMLDYQMKKFEDELTAAKKNPHIKRIIFIHGKGNGKLRLEITSFLDRNHFKYQDASFQKYGFGATMVFV